MLCLTAPVVAEELCPNGQCPQRPKWRPMSSTAVGSIRAHLAEEHWLVLPLSMSEQRCAQIHDRIHDVIGANPNPRRYQVRVDVYPLRDVVIVSKR